MCSDKINDAVFWNRSLEDKFWRGSGNAKNRDEMIAFAETDKLRRSSCCVVLFPLIGAPSWNESDWVEATAALCEDVESALLDGFQIMNFTGN